LIALLLVAIVAIFPRMSAHRKGIQESDIAKIIAMETVEYLQAQSAATPYGCGTIPIPADSSARVVGAVVYKITKIERPDDCVASASVYPVAVTVGWKKAGKTHSVKATGAVR